MLVAQSYRGLDEFNVMVLETELSLPSSNIADRSVVRLGGDLVSYDLVGSD